MQQELQTVKKELWSWVRRIWRNVEKDHTTLKRLPE